MTCDVWRDVCDVCPPPLLTLSLKEMVDVMGGSDCAAFAEFEDLCVLAFLAVRAPHSALASRCCWNCRVRVPRARFVCFNCGCVRR